MVGIVAVLLVAVTEVLLVVVVATGVAKSRIFENVGAHTSQEKDPCPN